MPPSMVDETAAARQTELPPKHVRSIEGALTAGTLIESVAGRAPLDSRFFSPFELPGELESSAVGGLNGGDGSNGSLD
jgi:hypothetical protein